MQYRFSRLSKTLSSDFFLYILSSYYQNQNLFLHSNALISIILYTMHHCPHHSLVNVTCIQETTKIFQEKIAWDLGVEPYKCDNSRLLAECNQLHQQQLRQRDHDSLRFAALSQQIRRLEIDKNHLTEHNSTLEFKLREFEQLHAATGDGKGMKQKTGRKPFISTVRGDLPMPKQLKQSSSLSHGKHSGCSTKCDEHHNNTVNKLQADIKNQIDLVDAYKKQVTKIV